MQTIESISRHSIPGSDMVLYGWDSRTETWHGPNALPPSEGPARRLLQSLQTVHGRSWYGSVRCCTAGEPGARFFTLIHDLTDCGLAAIYCDESKMGPAEILLVIPPARRKRLRPDFAFEFLAFARFLGAVSSGGELQIHDGLESAIANAGESETLIFCVSSGMWPEDQEHVLSRCVEKVAFAVSRWMQEPSA